MCILCDASIQHQWMHETNFFNSSLFFLFKCNTTKIRAFLKTYPLTPHIRLISDVVQIFRPLYLFFFVSLVLHILTIFFSFFYFFFFLLSLTHFILYRNLGRQCCVVLSTCARFILSALNLQNISYECMHADILVCTYYYYSKTAFQYSFIFDLFLYVLMWLSFGLPAQMQDSIFQ